MGLDYNRSVVKRTLVSVTGVGTETTTYTVPSGLKLASIQFTSGGIITTATGAPVTPIAGDDVTIAGSLSGNYFNLGESNAALAFGLDDNGVTTITTSVTTLQFTAAQVQATETWQMDLVLISD